MTHFTTHLTSDGGDARHNLWQLWHAREAALLREPPLYAPRLYYPLGVATLTHSSMFQFLGALILPVWAWGPVAAYNGALLLSHWLSGYCMYLLARGLRFDRGIALFAGIVLMVAPMRQAGTLGHLDKTFLGLLPLGLLALHHALNPGRSAWWAVATAFLLLLTLLHSGNQFVYAALAAAFFVAAIWRSARRSVVPIVLRRMAMLALSSLVLVGPLILAIVLTTRDPQFSLDWNGQSPGFQPDLVQLFIPSMYSAAFSLVVGDRFLADRINWSIETPAYVTWTGLSLCVVAYLRGGRRARRWLLFFLLCAVLALGPSLKLLGDTRFTEYRLPIILPYALLTELPGLDFMRTPARFMMLGFVGLGIAASFGLARLVRRFPDRRRPIIALAAVCILAETWPRPWPREEPWRMPEFYQQIAADDALYGVLDVPVKPAARGGYVPHWSHYQFFQMTHRKGIAAGYLSVTYADHPLFPCLFADEDPIPPDILVNGQPGGCYANAQIELTRHGYRYVVRHKPTPSGPGFRPGSSEDTFGRASIRAMFGDQQPILDDDLASVYAVSPATVPKTTLSLGRGWRPIEVGRRWAASPATLTATSPREQAAHLEIGPLLLHDPGSRNGLGTRGVLRIRVGDGPPIAVDVASDRATSVPVVLSEGRQTLSLALDAGNFRPRTYGGQGDFEASFAISSIDLRTSDDAALPIPDPLPS